jgi:hypothetical protein
MSACQGQNGSFVGHPIQTDPQPRNIAEEAGGFLFTQPSASLAVHQDVPQLVPP